MQTRAWQLWFWTPSSYLQIELCRLEPIEYFLPRKTTSMYMLGWGWWVTMLCGILSLRGTSESPGVRPPRRESVCGGEYRPSYSGGIDFIHKGWAAFGMVVNLYLSSGNQAHISETDRERLRSHIVVLMYVRTQVPRHPYGIYLLYMVFLNFAIPGLEEVPIKFGSMQGSPLEQWKGHVFCLLAMEKLGASISLLRFVQKNDSGSLPPYPRLWVSSWKN